MPATSVTSGSMGCCVLSAEVSETADGLSQLPLVVAEAVELHHPAIVGVLGACDADLVAVVDHRHVRDGEEEGVGHGEALEALGIVDLDLVLEAECPLVVP